MKRIIRILSAAMICATVSLPAAAQSVVGGEAEVQNLKVTRSGDRLDVAMTLDITALNVGGDETLVLVPVLENAGRSVELPAVEIMGRRAYMHFVRGGEVPVTDAPAVAERTPRRAERKAGAQTIGYAASTAYEPWMKGGRIVLREGSCGCDDALVALGTTPLDRILYTPYTPQYALAFVEPEPEPVKVRDESLTAYINFKVDKYDILEDYRDNARELASVISSVERVGHDEDLTITSVSIDGWASPEGTEGHNKTLSQNRANSLADYITAKTGLDRGMIAATGHGEDWAGLRNAVLATPRLLDQDKVLAIIDNTSLTMDQKDDELAKLIPPTIYERLMGEMYPKLRRNDYRIVYNVRNFNMEEARALIDTDPRKLSLGEMYRVAAEYERGSKQWDHVMAVAAATYPAQVAAAVNAAAERIADKDYDGALAILARSDAADARVLNAQGVAYSGKGDADRAREAFTAAAGKGSAEARRNLDELRKSLE